MNFAMVESYWLIGQQIVEHEQHGEARADYGKGLLKELAARLTTDFGKGFDESNLRYMRLFYRCFPKRDTLRHELTWSHFLIVMPLKDELQREFYLTMAASERFLCQTFYQILEPIKRKIYEIRGRRVMLDSFCGETLGEPETV